MSNGNLRSSSSTGAPASVTIEAKSLEQALVKAAGTLGVTQDEVAYEIIKEHTPAGLFSFFKTPVVAIRAWLKPRQEERRPGRRDRDHERGRDGDRERRHERRSRSSGRERERDHRDHDEDDEQAAALRAEPLSPEKVEALKEELRDFCAGICSQAAGEPVSVSAAVEEGRLVLNIDNEFIAQQITKNSKLAEAMEHILRKKPRHLRQELPFRIFVDVNGLRRQREDDLIQMAFDLSAKVHENKRPIVLNYKSSYDRKIIHMALDKDDRVYTKSIGSGPNRKLMILPNKDAQGGAEMMPPADADD